MKSEVKLNLKGLHALRRKIVRAGDSRAEVGIFADHNARDDGETNAAVGAKMEFGSHEESVASDAQLSARGRNYSPVWHGNPARSFLEMPLRTDLPHRVRDQSNLLTKEFVEAGPKAMLELVGIMGTRSVDAAFDTQGFGEWPPNSEVTQDWKGSSKPLIDSGQLRASVSSRVAASTNPSDPF